MSPYYMKFAFLLCFLSFTEGQSHNWSNRIFQDKIDALEQKDVAKSEVIQSLVQEFQDFKENALEQQKTINGLRETLEDYIDKLTDQDVTISCLKRNVEVLTKQNDQIEESLTSVKLELNNEKNMAVQRNQELAHMKINTKKQSEETEIMRGEIAELNAEMNHLKQYKTNDGDGRYAIGFNVQEDENNTNIPADNTKRELMTQLKTKQIPISGGNKKEQTSKKSDQELDDENTAIPDRTQVSRRNVGVQNGTTANVGFHAIVLKSGIQHLGSDQTIVFDYIRLNLGGCYNNNTGIFTAPKSGLYLFSVSIISDVGPKPSFNVALVKNGAWLASAYGYGGSGNQDQGSVTASMQLNVGDQVWVRSSHISDNSIGGYGYTSFTGVLISEM